ncbi:MAG TPA: alpha/beta fold hydrolase [Gemmataceae bacterium]|jgi:hypothetical protein|nr:alpha/beta fold hydrolase [Gemmataceae bacterium]
MIDTPSEFRPLPLLGNAHLQTLLGTWLKGPAFRFASCERHALMDDGDRLVLHDSVPELWRKGGRIAVLVHGLGGSHQSGHLQRMAGLLLPRGLRVVRLDLRGCGRGMTLARRSYHAGCSDDVRAAVAEVHRWSPASPLVLIGFSLGGNVVLKLAGEAAARPVPGLERVATVAPPIDLERCAALIGLARNRLYELHFVRELMTLARRRQQYFPDSRPLRFPRRMTLRLFDDLYTAPRSGFADALDYYRRASSQPFIPNIKVPTLILTARDDPFVAVGPFETLSAPPHVDVHIVARGGHLGFLGWDGAGGIRWAERRIADWAVTPNRS